MSKRGMSAAEKKVKLLELLHETMEFYQIKELEKLGPKRGIVQQAVKEVLKELTDEGTVLFDKVGSMNLYWSYPGTAVASKQAAIDAAKEESVSLLIKEKKLQMDVTRVLAGKEDTDARLALLARKEELEAKAQADAAELERYGEADPVAFQLKQDAVGLAVQESCRLTEAVLAWLAWAVNVGGANPAELRQMFEIGDEWEDGYC